MPGRIPTTKDVGLLRQLYKAGQLTLAPEYQRESVWPERAKSYLIDTILSDRPIPMLFFRRHTSAQSGQHSYEVIDGQQRLLAIFDFLDDEFQLVEATSKAWRGKYFRELPRRLQVRILSYDLPMEELSNYTDADARDVFRRMNRFVVKLSRQEMRHAQKPGAFFKFVEEIGSLGFWREQRVFSRTQTSRMRAREFAAELAILLLEGPQDKKESIDLYYYRYRKAFRAAQDVRRRLFLYRRWLLRALPKLSRSRFRKPTDLYGLIGAVDRVTRGGRRLGRLDPAFGGARLSGFEKDIVGKTPSRRASRYLAASSRQTDNLVPRRTRIEILSEVLKG